MQSILTFFLLVVLSLSAMAQNARVQFIHNSADTLMTFSEVRMNGDVKASLITYRSATAFQETAGDSTYTITFTSKRYPTKNASLTQFLEAGKRYVFILNGVTNDTTFDKNPDSISVLLTIVSIDQSTLAVPASDEVVWGLVNGTTDAAAFDLYSNDSLNVLYADDDSLNTIRQVLLLDTLLRLKLKTADGGFNISTFQFDLSTLGGQTVTALTTGYFASGSNQNGPTFSIYLVDSLGNIYNAQNVSVVRNTVKGLTQIQVFPNPARESVNLAFSLDRTTPLTVRMFNLKGMEVLQQALGQLPQGPHQLTLALPDLTPGLYILQLESGAQRQGLRLLIQR